MARIE
jgi:hypothetical protein